MEEAIQNHDFSSFAQLTCADSNQFHAVCLDTSPPIFYMNDTSHRLVLMYVCLFIRLFIFIITLVDYWFANLFQNYQLCWKMESFRGITSGLFIFCNVIWEVLWILSFKTYFCSVYFECFRQRKFLYILSLKVASYGFLILSQFVFNNEFVPLWLILSHPIRREDSKLMLN